jgi:hypothetical protein
VQQASRVIYHISDRASIISTIDAITQWARSRLVFHMKRPFVWQSYFNNICRVGKSFIPYIMYKKIYFFGKKSSYIFVFISILTYISPYSTLAKRSWLLYIEYCLQCVISWHRVNSNWWHYSGTLDDIIILWHQSESLFQFLKIFLYYTIYRNITI